MIGDKLYVVGGWHSRVAQRRLADEALVYDFENPDAVGEAARAAVPAPCTGRRQVAGQARGDRRHGRRHRHFATGRCFRSATSIVDARCRNCRAREWRASACPAWNSTAILRLRLRRHCLSVDDDGVGWEEVARWRPAGSFINWCPAGQTADRRRRRVSKTAHCRHRVDRIGSMPVCGNSRRHTSAADETGIGGRDSTRRRYALRRLDSATSLDTVLRLRLRSSRSFSG